MNDDARNMYKALTEASKVMNNPILDKVAKVGRFSYKYASLESILNAVKPPLQTFGLMLSQGKTQINGRDYLVTKVISEWGELTLDTRPIAEKPDPHEEGSAETYAKRYANQSAFGLCGVEDMDGAIAHEAAITKDEAESKQDAAREAGQALGDAINIYSLKFGQKPDEVRRKIREKLAQTGEGGKPEALMREAENLHQLVRLSDVE